MKSTLYTESYQFRSLTTIWPDRPRHRLITFALSSGYFQSTPEPVRYISSVQIGKRQEAKSRHTSAVGVNGSYHNRPSLNCGNVWPDFFYFTCRFVEHAEVLFDFFARGSHHFGRWAC